jgi:1,4-dihydroxy-2-naphthoate octaprenyltransferase
MPTQDLPRRSGVHRSADAALIPRVALVLALLVPAGVALNPAPAVRLVLVLAFIAMVPGTAVTAHVRIADPVVRTALGAVLGFAAFGAVSVLMVWWRLWHAQASLLVLAAASAVSLIVAIMRASSRTAVSR